MRAAPRVARGGAACILETCIRPAHHESQQKVEISPYKGFPLTRDFTLYGISL